MKQRRTQLLSLLLALVMLIGLLPTMAVSVAATDPGPTYWTDNAVTTWYDPAKNVFTISTAEQLAGLAVLVNNGTTFETKTIYLTADIDLGAHNWVPIGSSQHCFQGTFDGQGHVITNMKVNGTYDDAGLFGYLQGNVTNLGVGTGSFVTTTGENAGGLAGSAMRSITSCFYTGGEISAATYAGGIAGYSYGTIENCYSTVESLTAENKSGIGYAGSGSIEFCYSLYRTPANVDFGSIGQNYSITPEQGMGTSTADIDGEEESYFANTPSLLTALNNRALVFDYRAWVAGSDGYPVLATYWTDAGNYDTKWYDEAIQQTPSETSFTISSASELAGLAIILMNNGNDFSGKTIYLDADINLSDHLWVPINASPNYFSGTLDGQGHVIRNMTIETSSNAGLFGYFDNVTTTIRNVGIEDSTVSASAGFASALVPYASGSTVYLYNCYSTATVTTGGQPVESGKLLTNVTGFTVDNCYAINGTASTADGEYWSDSVYAAKTPADLKALTPTLNAWVTNKGTGYSTWYSFQAYNGGFPYFGENVTISGLTAADATYDGNSHSGYTGAAICKSGDDDVTPDCGTLVYTYYKSTGTGTWDSGTTTAPKDAGTYKLIVSVPASNTTYKGSTELTFTIAKADLTVTALDKTAYVGDTAPDFSAPVRGRDYTVTGLVGSDTLQGSIVLACTPDMNTANSYPITISGVTAPNDINYNSTITFVPGTLTVSARPAIGSTLRYTLTFETDGGAELATVTRPAGTTIDLADYTTTRSGYAFDGWYADSSLKDKLTSVKLIKNMTVYAKWTQNAGRFSDVASNAYYFDAVDWAVENGVTTGMTATTFAPNAVCTRAQAVSFLWRAMGSPAPKNTTNPFTDISANDYYYNAVLWAFENGITNGAGANTFKPNATVSRAEIVLLLWRAAGQPAASIANPFTDISDNAYYLTAVLWAVEQGITGGTGAGTFSPSDGCTRAQIVSFLYRHLVK